MYILKMNVKGAYTNHTFTDEDEFSLFVDGILYALDITDIKYTFREEINENECITTLKIEIV